MKELQEKVLKCKECGEDFTWTIGEQKYFEKKGLRHKPTRCKNCRLKNRQKLEAEYFRITCAECGIIGEVMFEPKNSNSKILCKNCFEKTYRN